MKKLKLEELNRVDVETFKSLEKIPVIVVLENIRSLSNIGSMFRTADAFKIEAIFLVGITARPPHREIQKTALGATESVDWKYFEEIDSALAEIRQKGYAVAAIEQTEDSTLIDELGDSHNGFGVILGNEVEGVEQSTIDQCDLCIELPQFGTKHSLNVSICGGIVMYEMLKKFN